MASSSNSSVQQSFKYDVFISFRGEETRKTFVDHLYEALQDKCINTYKDDEKIKRGKAIDNQLIQAIKDSRFFIIVFSENYASSSWCLDELVEIMDCQKTGEQTAYPVFFHVEPTEVRNQSGAFGKAFLGNKNEHADARGRWIKSLKGAAGLAGLELKNTLDGHEAKFIKKVIEEISLELPINLGFDEKLVGMETRVEDVVSSLEFGIDEVRMIGIKGMGGAGKTTTAKAVFDHLSNFEAKSFVMNVREVSNGSVSGLKELQEQVLSDVLNVKVTLRNVDDGKDMMKRRMPGKKVLLVLDDVDHICQLEALAGELKWFKPGSRIIITTRDEQVLVAHGVNLIRDIDLLSDKEAIFLFSRHAFGSELPSQGYQELSGKVVSYASGLPLTIKVLGSFLCRKDKDVWVDAIERLESIPLEETMKILELSYIALENDYREIFLDIACILKGETKSYAIRILESCGFHARNGLKVLEQRSLITISKDEVLGMHDHIEEMGKNIVRRDHRYEPNRHSRLWIDEEIEEVLDNDMGTEATRCLKLKKSSGNARIVMKGLGKMKKLRYLDVNFSISDLESDAECLSDTSCQYLSSSLKYLKCSDYPFLYLPKTFQANNLVGLEMKYSRMVQLLEKGEKKVFKKLKLISLSKSSLTNFDFRVTPNLETLSLNCSYNLEELYMPCQKLKHLDISHSKLRTFDFGLTPNIETLSLRDSLNLEELWIAVSCQKLKHLVVSKSKLRTFDLGLTPNLERLSLDDCADFKELHMSVACPNLKFLDLRKSRLKSLDLEPIPNLERLCLVGCDELVEIKALVGCLKKSVYLNLGGCLRFTKFVFLGRLKPDYNCSSASLDLFGKSLSFCPLHPDSDLLKLQFICTYKEYLASSVGNVEKLISFGLCACTDFEKISDKICSLQCLQTLRIAGDIPEFPKDLGQLKCLEELFLSSTKIKYLPDSICMLKRLKSLDVNNVDLLEKLPEDLGNLECLEKLYVRSKKMEYLPNSICLLSRLKCLDVSDCSWLGKLPQDIGQLESLERLDLSSTEIKHLPDSICMLKHLNYLNLGLCPLLEKLPEDLGQLECLEMLYVSSEKIEYLPDGICMLKRLKWLSLSNCSCLGKLPQDIGQLECLEKLWLSSTEIKHLPDSICMLKRLESLDVSQCLCLEKVPEDIGQLETLETLYLSAAKIKHLPDSICMLKHLKWLHLDHCALLEKLPEDLGRLERLKELDIRETDISHLPQSIFGLKGLDIFASSELLQKYENHLSSVFENMRGWLGARVGTKTENQDQAQVIVGTSDKRFVEADYNYCKKKKCIDGCTCITNQEEDLL